MSWQWSLEMGMETGDVLVLAIGDVLVLGRDAIVLRTGDAILLESIPGPCH